MTPLQCRKCGAILGVSEPHKLTVGGAIFYLATRIHCSKCSAETVWQPDKAKLLEHLKAKRKAAT